MYNLTCEMNCEDIFGLLRNGIGESMVKWFQHNTAYEQSPDFI